MQNFEALGRYVTAEEQVRKLAHERDVLLGQLANRIALTTHSRGSGYVAVDFDVAAAQAMLQQIGELHQNLLVAIQEANNSAEACNRPKLQLWKL